MRNRRAAICLERYSRKESLHVDSSTALTGARLVGMTIFRAVEGFQPVIALSAFRSLTKSSVGIRSRLSASDPD